MTKKDKEDVGMNCIALGGLEGSVFDATITALLDELKQLKKSSQASPFLGALSP